MKWEAPPSGVTWVKVAPGVEVSRDLRNLLLVVAVVVVAIALIDVFVAISLGALPALGFIIGFGGGLGGGLAALLLRRER